MKAPPLHIVTEYFHWIEWPSEEGEPFKKKFWYNGLCIQHSCQDAEDAVVLFCKSSVQGKSLHQALFFRSGSGNPRQIPLPHSNIYRSVYVYLLPVLAQGPLRNLSRNHNGTIEMSIHFPVPVTKHLTKELHECYTQHSLADPTLHDSARLLTQRVSQDVGAAISGFTI